MKYFATGKKSNLLNNKHPWVLMRYDMSRCGYLENAEAPARICVKLNWDCVARRTGASFSGKNPFKTIIIQIHTL